MTTIPAELVALVVIFDGTWITGGVLSMFKVTLAEAELPATSTAVPDTVWFSPSVVTVIGEVHWAMPDKVSLQLKLTVTFVLFQPFALACGLEDAVMVGRVLSMLTVRVFVVSMLPALSWP